MLRRMRLSSYSKVARNPFGVLVAVMAGMVCMGSVFADVASDMRQECKIPLMPLFACLTFVQGNAGSQPSGDCCNGMGQVLRSPKCLCGLLKDSPSAYINATLTYNSTHMLLVPSLCHLRANYSKCIDLLKLSPNSTDAQMFNQLANYTAHLPVSESPATSGLLPTSPATFVHKECMGFWRCHKRTALIAGSASAASLVIVFLGFLVYKKQTLAKATLSKGREEILPDKMGVKSTKLFSGKDMKKATNSFSTSLLLGSGGFGIVYKGYLDDGTTIAVKIAKADGTKSTEQVLNEVRILSQVNHKTVVHLLGCCVELDQPMLVYEFIPNGTLYDHIHTGRYGFLNWQQRLKIAHQAAQGLAYLHSFAVPPIYHRDVKSRNILLDEKCNAKVSDFGISRLVTGGRTHVTTCVQGTMGYLDPEYYRTYHLTDKSDVYSFGVVLLEILTSQRVFDCRRNDSDINLVVYVQHKVNEGTILDAVDRNLILEASEGSVKAMEGLCFLAIRCLHDKRQHRPSMKDVVEEISCMIRTEPMSTTFTSIEKS